MGCEKRWVARDEEFLDAFSGLRYCHHIGKRCAVRGSLVSCSRFFASGETVLLYLFLCSICSPCSVSPIVRWTCRRDDYRVVFPSFAAQITPSVAAIEQPLCRPHQRHQHHRLYSLPFE
jgi:hypothetical protein